MLWMISFITWASGRSRAAAGCIAGSFAGSDLMRARNLSSIVRRMSLLAFAAFSTLFVVAGRVSAAPGAYAQVASHFTIADFDGDNRPDFASVHVGQSSLQATHYWIAFQMSGRSGQTVSVTAPDGGLRITARDVNGDSFPDVVITTLWTNKPVAILLNDGLGNFTAANPSSFQSAFASPETSCMSVADEIRDATALLDSRSIPGDRGEESGLLSRVSTRRLLLPKSCSDPLTPSVSVFSGRAPPRL